MANDIPCSTDKKFKKIPCQLSFSSIFIFLSLPAPKLKPSCFLLHHLFLFLLPFSSVSLLLHHFSFAVVSYKTSHPQCHQQGCSMATRRTPSSSYAMLCFFISRSSRSLYFERTTQVCMPLLFGESMKRFSIVWWAYSFILTLLVVASAEYSEEREEGTRRGVTFSLSARKFVHEAVSGFRGVLEEEEAAGSVRSGVAVRERTAQSLDFARGDPWRLNTVHRVEELKIVVRMGPYRFLVCIVGRFAGAWRRT